MPVGQPLEFAGVTKRFGRLTAVDDFTARVEPGLVTGFLGPNGAGKTTSLRILLGLVRATSGTATIGGVPYAALERPLQTVGAVLEASSFHPGRTAAAHLTVYAQAAGIVRGRVDDVLELVGLTDAAGRKVGGFSLGMRQRLGLAYALLGDPGVLVLDEPANGLDPEGIRWMRGFLRQLAGEGRTVLVSSHLLSEVQQTVDALLIIAQGRLVFQGSLEELADPSEEATVVDSPDRAALAGALGAAGVPYEVLRSGLTVRGLDPAAVGAAAAAAGVALSTLHKRGPALEEVFLDLVNGTRVHESATGADRIPALEAGAGAAGAAAGSGAETARDTNAPADGSGASRPASSLDERESDAAGADAADGSGAFRLASSLNEREAAGAGADAADGSGAFRLASSLNERESADTADESGAFRPASSLDEREADAESLGMPGAAASLGAATYAVASTGVIDVVTRGDTVGTAEAAGDADDTLGVDTVAMPVLAGEESDAPPASDAPPEDADPDVEAIGDIDDELSDPVDQDPPRENDAKTDADLEADQFFAAFDEDRDSGEPEDAAESGAFRLASSLNERKAEVPGHANSLNEREAEPGAFRLASSLNERESEASRDASSLDEQEDPNRPTDGGEPR